MVKEIQAFQASDGALFETREVAELHNACVAYDDARGALGDLLDTKQVPLVELAAVAREFASACLELSKFQTFA